MAHIAVVGCGAMGRFLAAAAAAGGAETSLLCMGANRLRDTTIRLSRGGGVGAARVTRIGRLEPPLRGDLFIVATRSSMLDSVEEVLAGKPRLYVQPSPLVEQRLVAREAGVLGFYGCTWLDRNSGSLEYVASRIAVSPPGIEAAREAMEQLAEGLGVMGVRAELLSSDSTASLLWDYIAAHASTQPVAAVLGVTVGKLRRSQHARALVESLAREIMMIVDEKGVRKLRSPVDAAYEMMKLEGCRAKILVDIEQGRRSEVEYMNGLIVREALRLGLYAPYNDSLYLQVRSLEDLWSVT